MDLTAASHRPPKCGARGGVKSQVSDDSVQKCDRAESVAAEVISV